MFNKNVGLHGLLKKIDWIKIENKHGGQPGAFNARSFKISLMCKKKDNVMADKMNIYIGHELMNELGWEMGNKISFFHSKDDLCIFMGIKNAKGYKITKMPNGYCGCISMSWPHSKIKMNRTHAYECEYEIDEDNHSIAFRVTDNPDG